MPSKEPPPKPTQLPSQPVANRNNKIEKQVYQTEETNLPTYSISYVHDIHLRSINILSKDSPLVIEEIERESPKKTDISIVEEPSNSQDNQIQILFFPERLSFQQPEFPSEHDLLDELKNICIKIPLLQAIRNILHSISMRYKPWVKGVLPQLFFNHELLLFKQ